MNPTIPTITPDYNGMRNFTRLDTPLATIYYSYNTMVAFRYRGGPLNVSENNSSATTGRHINSLESNKKARLSAVTFAAEWQHGPSDGIDNLALAAIEGDGTARDAILDAIK